MVGVCAGEDEEEGVGGAGHEGEEVGVVDAVDVGEGEGSGEAELVGQVGHHFGVVLWIVESRCQ